MTSNEELWQVTTNYLCAAFVTKDGAVIACAPILRTKLDYWRTIARRVPEPPRPPVYGRPPPRSMEA